MLAAFLPIALAALAAAETPHGVVPVETDLVVKDFQFGSGEAVASLRLHYRTLGSLRRDAAGHAVNAVLLLHGSGGSGRAFLTEAWVEQMLSAGQPLDVSRWFVVIPDGIGHGGSSKPSDGARMSFPRYDYDDMVRAQRLVLEHLGVDRVQLLVGHSMGCMHGWLWVERFPEAVKAFVALSCQPSPVTGRNAIWRKMVMDAIRSDPAWNGGDYSHQPPGLRTSSSIVLLMVGNALDMEAGTSGREAALTRFDRALDDYFRDRDANDALYQWDASRTYDPASTSRMSRPACWP